VVVSAMAATPIAREIFIIEPIMLMTNERLPQFV